MSNWNKRYAETTIQTEAGDATVSAWVYAGEPEQRYESKGQPPHPGSDPEVDIICAYLQRNGTDVELSLSEEQEAEEKLIEHALDDENY